MPSYNLTFHLNDGSNTSSVYETLGEDIFPTIDYFGWSREGYNFLYWNVKSDGSSSYKYQGGDTIPTNFSMLGIEDIYAIWEVVIPTVTFYKVSSADLKSVADAIRAKSGTSEPLVYPDGFVSAIESIV